MDETKTSQAGCVIFAARDIVTSRTCSHSSTTVIFTTELSEISPLETSCWCGMTKSTLNIWVSHLKSVRLHLDLPLVRRKLRRRRGGRKSCLKLQGIINQAEKCYSSRIKWSREQHINRNVLKRSRHLKKNNVDLFYKLIKNYEIQN